MSRFTNAETNAGVHTAEIGLRERKALRLPLRRSGGATPAKLVIVDLRNPAAPQQVYSQVIGTPYVHDTFVRDGILFLGLWNAGVAIWDIGGGGKGGTPAEPGGHRAGADGERPRAQHLVAEGSRHRKHALRVHRRGVARIGRYFVLGDIHVVDVSNMAAPREVAFYTVPGAGTHNFSVDEPNGILYAAYYNGGVRAIDVRGDLGTCTDAQKSTPVNQVGPAVRSVEDGTRAGGRAQRSWQPCVRLGSPIPERLRVRVGHVERHLEAARRLPLR